MALALPLGMPGQAASQGPRGSDGTDGVDFTAIVALSNCSGSLVRFTSSRDSDPGLTLTNGHCYGSHFLRAGEVKANVASHRTFALLSSDGEDKLGTLTARRLVYATMTTTDLAIYELNRSFADIEGEYGVKALTLSDRHPDEGEPITIASGYWRRIYRCQIEAFIPHLREGAYTWRDSIRYSDSGCDVIGGTSGSPILDSRTHEVIGINNTGNESGERCTDNNPCEVDAEGRISVHYKTNYGEQTYWLYACLDAQHRFDWSRPSCALPRPTGSAATLAGN
jgi:V8-like Glu-specific endopeptidase